PRRAPLRAPRARADASVLRPPRTSDGIRRARARTGTRPAARSFVESLVTYASSAFLRNRAKSLPWGVRLPPPRRRRAAFLPSSGTGSRRLRSTRPLPEARPSARRRVRRTAGQPALHSSLGNRVSSHFRTFQKISHRDTEAQRKLKGNFFCVLSFSSLCVSVSLWLIILERTLTL